MENQNSWTDQIDWTKSKSFNDSTLFFAEKTKLDVEQTLSSTIELEEYIHNLLRNQVSSLEWVYFSEEYLDKFFSEFVSVNSWSQDYDSDSLLNQDNLNEQKKIRTLFKNIILTLLDDGEYLDILNLLWVKETNNTSRIKTKLLLDFSEKLCQLVEKLSVLIFWKKPENWTDFLSVCYDLIEIDFKEEIIEKDLLKDIISFYSISMFRLKGDNKIKTKSWEFICSDIERKIKLMDKWEINGFLNELDSHNDIKLSFVHDVLLRDMRDNLLIKTNEYLQDIEKRVIKYKYWVDIGNKLAIAFYESWVEELLIDCSSNNQLIIIKIILNSPQLFFWNTSIKDNELFEYLTKDLEVEKYENITAFMKTKKTKKLSSTALLEIFTNDDWLYFENIDKEENTRQLNASKIVSSKFVPKLNENESMQNKKKKKKTRGVPYKNNKSSNNLVVLKPKNKYDKYLLESLDSWDQWKINEFKESVNNFITFIYLQVSCSNTSSTENKSEAASWYLTGLIKRRYLSKIKWELDNVFNNKWVLTFDSFVADYENWHNCKEEYNFNNLISNTFKEKYLFDAILSYEVIIDYIWDHTCSKFKLVKEEFKDKIDKWLSTYFRDI